MGTGAFGSSNEASAAQSIVGFCANLKSGKDIATLSRIKIGLKRYVSMTIEFIELNPPPQSTYGAKLVAWLRDRTVCDIFLIRF